MTITSVASLSEIPDRSALEELLHEYYGVMNQKMLAAGGEAQEIEPFINAMWDDVDSYLPPTGRLLLATGPEGDLLGCGFMRQIQDRAGEMKRLYVRAAARGTGLGRKLVELRMSAAREMGWKTLLVDTVRGNQEMLTLYNKLGFREIDRYANNPNSDELAAYLVYLQYDFPG
ncbi:GNAT family N-acetyltransferase [Rhodovibrionaceae bacterium A322]